jgi:hypothetical protein
MYVQKTAYHATNYKQYLYGLIKRELRNSLIKEEHNGLKKSS